jgi:adenylate/guanylate cyclase family protein
MSELPHGTVTFLFTDVEGSTRLLRLLRDGYAEVLGEHQRLLRAAFGEYDGREVHTEGDAFFVAFARATDAVAAAVAAQRRLASHSWPDGVEVRVRMGVHSRDRCRWSPTAGRTHAGRPGRGVGALRTSRTWLRPSGFNARTACAGCEMATCGLPTSGVDARPPELTA